jgi:hypothetical protein
MFLQSVLMANGQYSMARNILTKITILPSEGAQYGRITYRQACIMEALDLLRKWTIFGCDKIDREG